MELGLLGPLRVTGARGDHPALGAKQRILLAALLLRAGRIVPMDELIDLMWDGDPPASARASLHNQVLALRRALGEDTTVRIHTRTPGYVIEIGAGELDLARFEELRESGRVALESGDHERAAELLRAALGIWRGEALVDVPSDALRREAAHLTSPVPRSCSRGSTRTCAAADTTSLSRNCPPWSPNTRCANGSTPS